MATRYLKHYYVESENTSEFILNTNQSRTGKTHPPIRSLDVQFWDTDSQGIDYCLSIVNDDDAIIPPSYGLEVLSFSDWANKAETYFNKVITENSLDSNQFAIDKTSLETIKQSFAAVSEHLQSLNTIE
jgi:hypothetical protein